MGDTVQEEFKEVDYVMSPENDSGPGDVRFDAALQREAFMAGSLSGPVIEQLDAKNNAYSKARNLLEDPDFLKSTSSEQAIIDLHKAATSSIDWDALKRAAPSEESVILASQSHSFAPGEYRDVLRVKMGEEPGDPSYLAPENVAEAMKELGNSIDKIASSCSSDPEDLTPYVLASWSYLKLVSIHPFVDGNGRAGELLMDWICKKTGREPIALNHDSKKLESAFDNCTQNPVIENVNKPAPILINEIKEATPESVLSDRGALEFTVALL